MKHDAKGEAARDNIVQLHVAAPGFAKSRALARYIWALNAKVAQLILA
jgi:hypothetical protein